MGKTNKVMTVVVIALVVIAIAAVFMAVKNVQFGPSGQVTKCSDSTAPVKWASQTLLDLNTPVTGISYLVQDDGSASDSNGSSYGVDHKLHYLASASGYIAIIGDKDVPCSGVTITSKLYKVASPTITVFNSNGVLIDNVATNQSAIGDGESAGLVMKFKGVNKETTGDMVCVIEVNSSVSTITLGGVAGKTDSKPEFQSTVVSNPKDFVFEVPAITGAITKPYDLVITSKDNAHYSGPVYYNCYAKQGFEDTDGVFKVGIQDSTGVATHAQATSGYFIVN